jgi:hypothetical protein
MILDPIGRAGRLAGVSWRKTHKGSSSAAAETAIKNNFRIDYGSEVENPLKFKVYEFYFVEAVDKK